MGSCTVHEGSLLQRITGQPHASIFVRSVARHVGSKGGNTFIGASVVGPRDLGDVIAAGGAAAVGGAEGDAAAAVGVGGASAALLMKRALAPRAVTPGSCFTCHPSRVFGLFP